MAKKAKKKAVKKSKKTPAPKPKSKIAPYDAVLFDIDNVLIDTRKSYLEAIRWTVDLYLTHGRVPFFEPDKRKTAGPYLLKAKDVEHFKMLGGFNDDWDCCYGLLVYLLNLPAKERKAVALKKVIDVPKFVKKVSGRPLGVSGIVKMLGRPQGVTIERISRIFQEVYLGKSIFEKAEQQKAIYWKKRGLISKEKMIFRKSTLARLQKMGVVMGIATGRPRFEALFALKAFNALSYFEAMTTIDEVKKAERQQRTSLRKPHPFSLIETAKKLGKDHRFVYVGDLPDDMLAAKKAKNTLNIGGVGFPAYGFDPKKVKEELKNGGADFILEKPGNLPNLLQSPTSFKA